MSAWDYSHKRVILVKWTADLWKSVRTSWKCLDIGPKIAVFHRNSLKRVWSSKATVFTWKICVIITQEHFISAPLPPSHNFSFKHFPFIPKKVHLWAHLFEQNSKRTFNLIHKILFHIISIIKWKISCIQIIFETTHTHLPVKRLIK